MKKVLLYTLLAATLSLSSCEDAEWNDSQVQYYPVLNMQGDAVVENPIGTPYKDAGCLATFGGEDYTSHIVTTGVDNVDVNTAGLYKITYSAINEKYPVLNASVTRTVAVCDPTITTNISGTWKGIDGTYRDRAGALTPYPGYSIKVRKDASGIFYVSDLLDGYYAQHAGYGAKYACVGYLQLLADNTLVMLSSSVAGWGDSADSFEGAYDPATGLISYVIEYAGMKFYAVLSL